MRVVNLEVQTAKELEIMICAWLFLAFFFIFFLKMPLKKDQRTFKTGVYGVKTAKLDTVVLVALVVKNFTEDIFPGSLGSCKLSETLSRHLFVIKCLVDTYTVILYSNNYNESNDRWMVCLFLN